MNEIMLDIETLDTDLKSSIVLSIGAVRFSSADTDSDQTIMDDPTRTFYRTLEIDTQEAKGRTMNSSTVLWWIGQSTAAKAEVVKGECDTLEAIADFNRWASGADYIWGNGNMFDIGITLGLWEDYGMKYPVSHRGFMDMRTLVKLNGGRKPSIPIHTAHHALDDAILQTRQVQEMTRALGI